MGCAALTPHKHVPQLHQQPVTNIDNNNKYHHNFETEPVHKEDPHSENLKPKLNLQLSDDDDDITPKTIISPEQNQNIPKADNAHPLETPQFNIKIEFNADALMKQDKPSLHLSSLPNQSPPFKQQQQQQQQQQLNSKYEQTQSFLNNNNNNATQIVISSDKALSCALIPSLTLDNYHLFPFQLECEEDPDDPTIVTATIQACRYELMYPIWVNRGSRLQFEIKGQWKINAYQSWPEKEYVDSSDSSFSNNKDTTTKTIEHGALCGRFLDEDEFQINNNLIYVPQHSSPLFLKMYIYSYEDYKPSGSLLLTIHNVEKITPLSKLEEMMGWKSNINEIHLIDDIVHTEVNTNGSIITTEYQIPSIEKEVMILLNKLRDNSHLFAKQYLYNISKLTNTTLAVYNELLLQKEQYMPFVFNVKVAKCISEYYGSYLGDKNTTKNKKEFIMKSRLDLQKYINMKFVGDNTKNVKVFLREHNDTKVVSLAVLCLLNDDIRKNVFNKNNVEMTIVMFRIAKNGQMSYVTLLAFGEGKIRNESEDEESEDGVNAENKKEENGNDYGTQNKDCIHTIIERLGESSSLMQTKRCATEIKEMKKEQEQEQELTSSKEQNEDGDNDNDNSDDEQYENSSSDSSFHSSNEIGNEEQQYNNKS